MWFPRFLVLALALNSICPAQTGTVIFYCDGDTAKDSLKRGVVPVGRGPFPGWLYDGTERLAHFEAGRFITLRLEPGSHLLSASGSSRNPDSKVLPLVITSAGNSCVRLSAQYENWIVLPFYSYQGRIEQVPCDQAFKQAGNIKPLKKSRIDKAAQDKLDPVQEFPKDQP